MTDLATRLEQGTAEQQRELLIAVFEVIHGERIVRHHTGRTTYHPLWFKFNKMLNAEAYESAALMLVPEGWTWTLRSSGFFELRHPDKCNLDTEGREITLALALAAAALRARENSHD